MLPKAIILIGPDKAGKTTLVNSLLQIYPWMNYSKGSYMSNFEEMTKRVETEIQKAKQSIYPTIFDRFHYPDELIYASLNRGESISEEKKKWLNLAVAGELHRIGTLFVFCHANVDDLVKRFKESNDKDIKAEWLEQLLEAYKKWFADATKRFRMLSLNSSQLSEQEMVDQVKKLLESTFPLKGPENSV